MKLICLLECWRYDTGGNSQSRVTMDGALDRYILFMAPAVVWNWGYTNIDIGIVVIWIRSTVN